MPERPSPRLRRMRTEELSKEEVAAIRALLDEAFGDDHESFSEDDWQHSVGGTHFVLDVAGEVRAHASVVERELHVAGRPVRTGYVEAVATAPGFQRTGLGTIVMRDVGAYIAERFELGALGTSSRKFYERLGWQRWRGPTSVRTAAGITPTPEEDGYILVLMTPFSPRLDLWAPISCEWRAGDVW